MLEEKLALVYEYNNHSPLFVRAAGIEIKRDNLQKAIGILTDGLKLYPDYPTAYILLGKALLTLGSFDKAEEAFIRGSSIIASRKTLNHYITELENTRKKELRMGESRRIPFVSEELEKLLMESNESGFPGENRIDIMEEEFQEDEEQPANEAFDSESADVNNSIQEETEESIDERLADLAKEISFARISPVESSPENEHTDHDIQKELDEDQSFEESNSAPGQELQAQKNMPIVSETLAKIYISQGKFHEALGVYKQLLVKTPDKKEYYQARINEIESQLNDW